MKKRPNLILSVLWAYPQEMTGEQLLKRSHGRLKISTIYVHLCQLEKKGFIASRFENTLDLFIVGKRFFRLTQSGLNSLDTFGVRAQFVDVKFSHL